MKWYCKILVSLLFPTWLCAQTGTYYDYNYYSKQRFDSLQAVFKTTANDTVKMAVCRDLGLYYNESKTDSALYFHTIQTQLAKKLNQKLWEADAHDISGYVLASKGEYTSSLQHLLEAQKIAKDRKTENNIWRISKFSGEKDPGIARLTVLGNSYNDLSVLYNKSENTEKELASLAEAKKIGESINDSVLLSYVYQNLGQKEPNTDSALMLERKSLVYSNQKSFKLYHGYVFGTMAGIFSKRAENDSAAKYYRDAVAACLLQGNLSSAARFSIEFAAMLPKTEQPDSSLYYARQGLAILISNNEKYGLHAAYATIAAVHKSRNRFDSAFFYLEKSNTARDSVANADKVKQFESVGFEQELKLQELEKENIVTQNRTRTIGFTAGLGVLLLIGVILYRNSRIRKKANIVLEKTLKDLKATQSQLIQSEKMASLGEMTAGVAHEIQNPLNFVNNFSELNKELADELKSELIAGNVQQAVEIADDIIDNSEKIDHHGKRAEAIVKGMLQHSQRSSGEKEPTDINVLADEYLRLAYHGLRAKDKDFNISLKTDFDDSIGKISIIPQDIGRVLLNLYNNAFYACAERRNRDSACPDSALSITTKRSGNNIVITVTDNGTGIDPKVIDKIFQPFFTTKPTGQGTGLGLSLAYDIITRGHGGELKVNSAAGEGTEFSIILNAGA